MLQKSGIAILVALVAFQSASAASFSCGKAKTRAEHLICSNGLLSSMDEQLAQAYAAALLHSTNRDELRKEQMQWLAKRDACRTAVCMMDLSVDRTTLLLALAERQDAAVRPSGPCYVLRDRDINGKRTKHESVCGAMSENLNQFCSRPPMVCSLEVAPSMKQKILLPQWVPVSPTRELVDGLFGRSDRKDAVDLAMRERRLSVARSDLDLLNEGAPRSVYRVDLGDCVKRNSANLEDRSDWGEPVVSGSIQVTLSHDEQAAASKTYTRFPDFIGEVFTFEKRVYSYGMYGEEGKPNRVDVQRAGNVENFGHKHVLTDDTVCTFDYLPNN